MSDYIKRENAKRAVWGCARDTGIDEAPFEYAESLLEDVPSEDVAPVRHGRWIETSYDEFQCSVCKKVVREEILYAIKPSDREDASMNIANYCPNCGAKMYEEEKHGQK